MREQEVRELYEAYMQVHQVQEEVEQLDEEVVDEAMSSYDRNRRRAAQRAAERNAARDRGQTGNVPGVGYVSPRRERETYTGESGQEYHKSGARMPKKEDQKESFDLFDTILEYLVAEGYAETNEAALVIMANMSEEWRQDIMEISQQKATDAYATSSTGEFEGADSPRDVERTNRLRKHIVRKFGAEAGEHADAAADARTFGRRDASGRRKQSPEPRIQTSDHRTTQDGKMHKQDQRELKTNLRIKRDRRLRAAEDN